MIYTHYKQGEKYDIEEYWRADWSDGGIYDVGVDLTDVETGEKLTCDDAYFEAGVDEYYLNEERIKEDI